MIKLGFTTSRFPLKLLIIKVPKKYLFIPPHMMIPKTHEIMVNLSIFLSLSFSPSPNPWIVSVKMFWAWVHLSSFRAQPWPLSSTLPWKAATILLFSFISVFYTQLLVLLFDQQFLPWYFFALPPLFVHSLSLSDYSVELPWSGCGNRSHGVVYWRRLAQEPWQEMMMA